MKQIGSGMTADAYSLPGGLVKKQYRTFLAKNFNAEVECLQRLTASGSKHFPKLQTYDPHEGYIIMQDAGTKLEALKKIRCPDWKNQCQEIIRVLDCCGIRHNDLAQNIHLQNKELKLIDFGHAYPIPQHVIFKKNYEGWERGNIVQIWYSEPVKNGVLVVFSGSYEKHFIPSDIGEIQRLMAAREDAFNNDYLLKHVELLYNSKNISWWRLFVNSVWIPVKNWVYTKMGVKNASV